MRRKVVSGLVGLGLIFTGGKALALEINEKLSTEINLTWVHQWLKHKKGEFQDKDRGSLVVDGSISFKPTEKDELFLRASLAKENGLKKINPFVLSPNADDLRDDLHNINARSRDHLMEFWYARTFDLPGKSTLKTTLGIIDATAFLDDNRLANDELTQFMNEAFVNSPLANLISYDYGVALEWEKGPLIFKLLGMQSQTEAHENPRFHKKNYNYYGAQIGFKTELPLGEGNYRLYFYRTNKKFPDWEENSKKALKGWGVSLDQDLIKERLGLFGRISFQDDAAQINYKSMYSLGLNYQFCLFNRKPTLGIGYSYLKAPSQHKDLKHTKVWESYLAIPLYEKEKKFSSVLTLDWQYIKDRVKKETPKTEGSIWGLRLNITF